MSLDYRIGTSVGTMVTLASLGLIDPQPVSVQYAGTEVLADGSLRGVGWLEAAWRFSFVTDDQIAALRAYCGEPAMSGTVTIKTVKSGGGMEVYTGKIWWPQVEPVLEGQYYEDFLLRFVDLEKEAAT